MLKKKARKNSIKAGLARVKKETTEPRLALSVRVEAENPASGRIRGEHSA